MSPSKNQVEDQESESQETRPGRPAVAHHRMLLAADRLFSETDTPTRVTMDAIADAAGVGKGTLFRAFGSREGLLDTLWASKLATLRANVEEGAAPLGPAAPPRERAIAFLDALLMFKLENRHLIRALELTAGILQSDHYRWMHGLLQHLIEQARSGGTTAKIACYTAHVLLAALHIDLIEEMLATDLTLPEIRRAQADRVRSAVDNGNN